MLSRSTLHLSNESAESAVRIEDKPVSFTGCFIFKRHGCSEIITKKVIEKSLPLVKKSVVDEERSVNRLMTQ